MNWLTIKNLANKVVELNIEGVIGGGWFEEGGATMEQVNSDLKDMKAIEADVIRLNIINSPGGSVLHGLGIVDILNGLPAKKEVNILGMAASMAAVVSMVAKTEDRSMTPNSFFLIHRLRGGASGTIPNIETDLAFFKKNEEKLVNILMNGTGKDQKEIEDMMNEANGEGIFYTAQETMDKKYIGKIAGEEPKSMAAFVENLPGLPALPKNLIKGKTAFDIDGIIKTVVSKVAEIFTAKNKTADKAEIEGLVKTEVDALKATFDAGLKTETDKAVDLAAKLEIEKQRNAANEIKLRNMSDPDLGDPNTATMGRDILKQLSYSDRIKLRNNTKNKH